MRPRFLSCVPRPLLVLRVIVGLSASLQLWSGQKIKRRLS